MMNNIKFYSTEWCGDCVRSKKLLEKLGITYEEIDIDFDKEAYKKVIESCKKYGKTPGMGGVYNEELMSEYINMGMKFILSGSDLSFMMSSALQRSKNLRSFQNK